MRGEVVEESYNLNCKIRIETIRISSQSAEENNLLTALVAFTFLFELFHLLFSVGVKCEPIVPWKFALPPAMPPSACVWGVVLPICGLSLLSRSMLLLRVCIPPLLVGYPRPNSSVPALGSG